MRRILGRAKPKTIAKGIRRLRYSFEVRAHVNGRVVYRSFPETASVREMHAWQQAQIVAGGGILPSRRVQSFCSISRDAEDGHVYFIGDDRRRVKIGISVDPAARLRSLQTSVSAPLCLLASGPAYIEVERILHKRFAAARLSGEWFTRTPAIDALIDAVRQDPHVLVREYLAARRAACQPRCQPVVSDPVVDRRC